MSMIPLATSGNLNAVNTTTFSSIPSTFNHLQLRIFCAINAVTGIYLRFNSDTGNNYRSHNLYGDGSTATAYDYGNSNNTLLLPFPFQGVNSSTSFACYIVDILDYTNTNKNKVTKSIHGVDRNGTGQAVFASGLWMNTNAITSITIATENGTNFTNNSVAQLYGVLTSPATGA